jgi:enoyl-CoA hydratase/carnithine racemase
VQLGLGSRVLDAGDVLPTALELAHDIVENTAPMSVAASKRLLWDSFDLDRRPLKWSGTPRDPTA